MSQTTPQQPRKGAGKGLMIAALVAALGGAGVGAYYAFFDAAGVPPPAAVGGTALVGAGEVGDVAAYLDRMSTAEEKARVTYRVEGNSLLDLAGTSPDGKSKFTIEEIEFKALDTEHDQPHFVDMRITNLAMTAEPGALPAGLTELAGNIVYAYEYDPATRTLDVPAIRMDFEGVGSIDLRGSFSEIDLFAGTPDEALAGIAGAKINAFALVLTDQVVIKSLLEEEAKKQGVDLATLKTQASAMLTMLETQLEGDIEKQAIRAAKVILDKTEGVTVTITATPAEPFPVAQFLALGMGAGGMPDLTALKPLNLTIEAQ